MSHDEPKRGRARTAADKLRILQQSAMLSGTELGALLRREGVHEAELKEWSSAADHGALEALSEKKRSRTKKSSEQKQIEALKKELVRKESALAEVAALLVLKKRVQEIWGDADDDTDMRTGK